MPEQRGPGRRTQRQGRAGEDDTPTIRGGRERETRQAPSPAHDEGARREGSQSPAAVWGNPRAVADPRDPPDPGREMARERGEPDEDDG